MLGQLSLYCLVRPCLWPFSREAPHSRNNTGAKELEFKKQSKTLLS